MKDGAPAQFYDGKSAGRHDVRLALSDDRQALIISAESLPDPLRWALADLRGLRDMAGQGRLTLTRHLNTDDETLRDPARLIIVDPEMIAWILRSRPNLLRHELRKGTWARIAKWIGGSVAAVLLMLFVILPAMANTLARIIPIEREIAFGKVVIRQMEVFLGGVGMGEMRCTSPEGLAALEVMLERLTANREMEYDIVLQVFNHEMINAFAVPGGQVIILRGLIDKSQSPDELAGVLAHEIAHVESRDPTRHSLRAAGSAGLLTMVLGDFSGGAAIAVMGEHILSASFTREAEAEADIFALDMLNEANISARGFARFFGLIEELQSDGLTIPQYLSTHPVTRDRAEIAMRFAQAQSGTKPALSASEWKALKGICTQRGRSSEN